MLTRDAVYRQLKLLLDVSAIRLGTCMMGGPRRHCGPQSSEESTTFTPGLGDGRQRLCLLFILVPPFYLDGFGCVNNLWHTISPLHLLRR
jgi:hypothetical protein